MRLSNLPRLERILLHTNALLWTEARWLSIPSAVRALIRFAEISIDAATPGIYKTNRRGGSFSRLLSNLDFVARLRSESRISYLKFSFVVQDNDFREMPDFVALAKRFAADVIYFSRLANWGTFSGEELVSRMVHEPTHPNHRDFLAVLRDERMRDPQVSLGSLSEFLPLEARRAMPGRGLPVVLPSSSC